MVRKQHKWGDPRWKYSTQFEECYYCGIKRVQIPGKVKINTYIYGHFGNFEKWAFEEPECSEMIMRKALG